MSSAKDICVLLPVLNEANNIGPLLNRIGTALAGRDYVICIVDDGSRDGTVEYLRNAMKTEDHRLHLIERTKAMRGSQRGSALFAAMVWTLESTECQTLVEMDGDLSHRPEELPKGLSLLESGSADVVIASKYLPGSQVINRPVERRVVSALCNIVVRLLISSKITDYSNGYRMYTRNAAKAIAETRILYASPIYLTEAMGIWLSRGLRVREFASTYVGRNEGLSKLRLIDLMKASVGIFEVAYRLHVRGFAKNDYARPSEMADILSKKSALLRSQKQ